MNMMQAHADLGEVERDLGRAGELLNQAECDLAAGRAIDLTEFNAILDCTCVNVVRLPQTEYGNVRAKLKALLKRLESMRADVANAVPAN